MKFIKTNQGPNEGIPMVSLKTLCTQCQCKITCVLPKQTEFDGKKCTAEEYMGHVLMSKNFGFYCKKCAGSIGGSVNK